MAQTIKISKESLDAFKQKTEQKDTLIWRGVEYVLNQCADIFKWCSVSKVGEFTRFYSKTFFHAEDGIYAAYSNDLNNYVAV